MCLACHDGNVAKGAMMQNWAYEQQIGALPTSYGAQPIPTLLSNSGAATTTTTQWANRPWSTRPSAPPTAPST